MKVVDFDYELPEDRIAQRPLPERDASRLLTLDLASGELADRRFVELPELLAPGDLLVLNDTRVLPARLIGRKASGGRVELLMIDPISTRGETEATWDCWLRSARGPRPGTRLNFEAGLTGEVVERRGELWTIRLSSSGGALANALERAGSIPLPPYIRREEGPGGDDAEDRRRYQTVFASRPGAVAAPTAGLHFSEELLARIEARGVRLARLTLHVGPGTFQPIRVEAVADHRMHAERFEIPQTTAEVIADTRRRGGRVVAVGTTVVRTLEHGAGEGGNVRAGSGRSDLFIVPGYRFRVVDALITNFHLPRSTLLMLVAAFAGTERVLSAYRHAVERGYRFFSYGDAMWLGSGR